jgi:phosphopantothenoylcysteine synthetase/decarboxylase
MKKSQRNKSSVLAGKKIIIGISGGIAAYKAPELVRILRRQGADVTCVLTQNAKHFVTPLTLQTLSQNNVYGDMFEPHVWDIEHIALAKQADMVAVVPATADLISRLACGRANDLLTSVVLSTVSPVLICPAMNEKMWEHPATRENIGRLKKFGYNIVQPEKGELACGDTGTGRLADLGAIAETIKDILEK